MHSNEIEILKKQEEILQFDKFNHDEAYKLGTFMIEYAKKHNVTIAVSIRLANGFVVFQYGPEGTGLMNQRWMKRKFNTVWNWGQSSLCSAYMLEDLGEDLTFHTLDAKDFALCGGGFPIRVKGCTGVVGAVLSSNLYHVADHEFIIDCLKEYLNKPEVPTLGYKYKD